MRRFLFSILTFLLTFTLCVNFVRYIIYDSSGSQGEFQDVSVFTVMDSLSKVNVNADKIYNDILNAYDQLGKAGFSFVSAFSPDTYIDGNFFDKVVAFFQAFWNMFVGIVRFIVNLVKYTFDILLWIASLLRVLYELLNSLFGTSFGVMSSNIGLNLT